MILHFNYNFFTLLQQTLYLGCGNTALPISAVDTNYSEINTNIVARSDLYCLFLYFTCSETSFMFGEQEVLIPSMLLCSLCDSLNSCNSSRFVVVRTSNMAASIHWPASCSRVSKNRSGYPLV